MLPKKLSFPWFYMSFILINIYKFIYLFQILERSVDWNSSYAFSPFPICKLLLYYIFSIENYLRN